MAPPEDPRVEIESVDAHNTALTSASVNALVAWDAREAAASADDMCVVGGETDQEWLRAEVALGHAMEELRRSLGGGA